MIVVADTSVILNLCRIRHERLLPQLFGRIVVPEEVATEFNRLGLRTIGILGVLLESRRRGLIPGLKAVLDQLETEAGFWLSPQLRLRVLRLAGE